MTAAFPLILAAVSALLFTRRRAVYALGPSGAWLAPAFLWSLWYAFLWLGHLAGSLAGAGTIAALPLAASAYWAIRKTRPRRIYSRGLTAPDWTATTLIAACLIAQPTFNFETHIPLIETYLRGNVPPCDYNDPAAPLNYHALYSASAALFAKAFGFSADFALDAVSIALLPALLLSLHAAGRALFKTERARQAARLLFLFGLGPIYLRPGHPNEGYWFLHGWSNQSFVEAVLRPTAMLNLCVFSFLLAALLPRLPSRDIPGTGARRAPAPLWLLPAAFMLPQASEELAGLTGLAIIGLWLSGRFPGTWALGGIALAAGSAATSGVVREVLFPRPGVPHPQLFLQWPPILLSWMGGNKPLFSWEAAKILFWEWGPVYAAALWACKNDPRRRTGPLIFAICFGTASSLVFGGDWSPQDLDRLFFYSTPFVFMLSALWIEKLKLSRARSWALVLFCVLGPLACSLFRIHHFFSRPETIAPFLRPPPSPLIAALAEVGPREQLVTDKAMARPLLLAGFVVASPPFFHENKNLLEKFEEHMAGFRRRPTWYFLPENDPRLAGLTATASYKGRILARTSP